MKVLKFGGSSVANPDTIRQVFSIVENRAQNERFLITFSAFQGITNQLILCGELAANGDSRFRDECQKIRDRHLKTILELLPRENHGELESKVKAMLAEFEEICYGVYLLREFSNRTKDSILSFGEILSCTIITQYFNSQGLECRFVDSRELIKTDDNFSNARVNLEESYSNIQEALGGEKRIIIAPGFIGSSPEGQTSTLGRGGSDYSAAIFAHALNAEAMEKWTDVSGMLTSDPRIVKSANVIQKLSYQEAMELCHFGAKVIYPPTIHPLLEKEIPIIIKNTFSPEDAGTHISMDKDIANGAIKGLSSIDKIALISLSGSGMVGIPGFSRRMFTALSHNDVNVILITQASSEHSITVGIDQGDSTKAVACLEEEFAYDISLGKIDPIDIETKLSIVAMVGDNMRHQTGVSGNALHTLGKNGVNIRAIAQGSSERNISIVIKSGDVKKALNSLHESFFSSEIKQINVFVVGIGNVGNTLLNQIQSQKKELLEKHHIDLEVVGISNSQKMIFNAEGIDLEIREAELENGETADLKRFVNMMKAMNLRNSVFVDNTASESIVDLYEIILRSSISVVASNKTAASSSFEKYSQLKKLALKFSTDFLFETNVGAGLPIIDTIQNLIKSGDEIHEIKAVLSGSLNFVFNNYQADTAFVDIVKQAMAEGYTEPDPRLDLSGKDVQRKILILAREKGLELEMDDIENTPFLSEKLLNEGSVDDFLNELGRDDKDISNRLAMANKNGNKLKYVASLIDGKAKVSLEEVSSDHPFYSIEGSDNIVLIKSSRYKNLPLVIKGAGAGAEVTAMGVFADIIRIAND